MAMPAYLGGRFNNTGVKWHGSNAANRADGLPRSIHVFILNDTVTGATGPGASPYFRREWLRPGAFLPLLAAARFDDDFIKGGATLVVDYRGLYDSWHDEYGVGGAYRLLGIPGNHWWDLLAEGMPAADRITRIGDISAGRAPGRTSDGGIILYSVGGIPVEDVAVARGIGITLNLWDRPVLS